MQLLLSSSAAKQHVRRHVQANVQLVLTSCKVLTRRAGAGDVCHSGSAHCAGTHSCRMTTGRIQMHSVEMY